LAEAYLKKDERRIEERGRTMGPGGPIENFGDCPIKIQKG